MFKKSKKPQEPKESKPKKLSALMQLLAQKLEYYPDPNRKEVILDLMREVEAKKL